MAYIDVWCLYERMMGLSWMDPGSARLDERQGEPLLVESGWLRRIMAYLYACNTRLRSKSTAAFWLQEAGC